MTDTAVLEILHAIRADLSAVKSEHGAALAALRTDMDAVKVDLATVKADLADKGAVLTALRTDIAAITDEIANWPDLHVLHAAALAQFQDAGEAREQRRYIEIRLDEVHSAMATGPEVTGLRSDVTTSMDRQRELDLRIAIIESRLGIGNPLEIANPFGAGHPLAPE